MTAKVQLRVKWAGDTPGLAEHRLDLDAFLTAVSALNSALKWVASSMIAEADDPGYGGRGGQLKARARGLRVQWSAMRDGCVTNDFDLTMFGQQDAFDDLPRRTVIRFVEHVEDEAAGRRRSAVVRRFLDALPDHGLASQTYTALVDGEPVKSTTLHTIQLPVEPTVLPSLFRGEGEVVGAFFEPGRTALELRVDGKIERLAATDALVERGLGLRGERVRFVAVANANTSRLIRLGAAADPQPNAAAAGKYLRERWGEVLRRLGEGPGRQPKRCSASMSTSPFMISGSRCSRTTASTVCGGMSTAR